MPITIRELLASDTISQAADKINFNFDQLLLNGGGPQGPQGPQGPPGPIGGRGIRGSVWYEDTSTTSPGNNPNTVPPTLTPEDEDNYLQFNGVVWTYDASIPAWVPTNIDLTGPVGPPGASGKFGEYQALPYTAAGDTTIFPDRMSAASEDALNQAVRSVLIGGFPETIYNPTPSIPGGTSIVSDSIAQSLVKNSYTMMLHQFDSNDTALVFHGGDITEDFEQAAIAELSYIKLQADDALRIVSPKARTGSNAFPGIYIEASNRAIDLDAGRELTIRTGTANTSDNYLGQDNFEVLVAQSTGNPAEPYARIRTIVPGQQAELKIGETSIPTTTTTNSGNLVGLAGRISLIGSNAMNLRTTSDITIDAGTSIDIDAGTDIDIEAGASITVDAGTSIDIDAGTDIDIEAGASIDIIAGTSITVDADTFIDIDANTDIDINAGSTIDMIGAGLVTVQSTGNNLRLWATDNTSLVDVYSGDNVDVHAKDGDVHIFTEPTGGDVLIDTSNDGTQIKLETTGDTSPIYLRTNSTASPISLQTVAASDISLTSGDDINMSAADDIVLNALAVAGTIDMNADIMDMDAATNISMRSPEITIISEGGAGEITLTKNTATAVVNIRPTFAAGGSYLNVYSNNPATDGIRVTSFASGYITIDALGATDKLIIQGWDQTAGATGGGQSLGFEVNGTIDVDGNDQINAALDEKIFSSGRFTNDSIGDFSTVVVNWMRVGNTVTGSGFVSGWDPLSLTPSFDAPITGPSGLISSVYGSHVNNSNGEGGPVIQGFGAGTIRLQATPAGFGPAAGYYFTFSYRLV